jgi:hypothetical protein
MQKTINWMLVVLAAGLLAAVGCKKAPPVMGVPKYNGVSVDIPKVQEAFANNTAPEVQGQLTQLAFGMRYGDYMKSLMALDKLLNDPSTTEPQKKIVTEVIEQIKQAMANQAKPAP